MVNDFLPIGLFKQSELKFPVSKAQDNQNSKNQIISEEDIMQYVIERFNDVKESKKMKNIVCFHAMNKYMIMAHDQEELNKLGNIVANHRKVPLCQILDEYEKHLKKSFRKKPTIKTHSNVVMHIFGYFSKNLNQYEKEMFIRLIEKFKNKKITIGHMLYEINPVIFRFNNTYLASQTYFLLYTDPQPRILFQALNPNNEN